MKELVEVIAKALVDNPDEVKVSEEVSGKTKIVKLSVARSDMGKVIGRQGRIAKSIRTVVKAAAMRDDEKVIVDIDD
ncbi:MAG: KH domain-containing protein [Lachnospiraceae bacterium]|nr:KH domain-containing protein [Lachnospiraceae bacterium]MBQ6259558.1 KH domain-containing protein [Lachnospiraceae bacterium]